MKNQLPRHIPQNSTPIERAGLPAIVYSFTTSSGQPAAIAYCGNSSKPTWHYRFRSEAQRQDKIDTFFNGVAQHEDFKLARKVERTSFRHTLKVGDVLDCSWGYDQTNVDFYQVVATTEKTVTFREICQDRTRDGRFDSGTCSPIKDAWAKDSKEYTRTVGAGNSVAFAEYEGGMRRHLSLFTRTYANWSDGH